MTDRDKLLAIALRMGDEPVVRKRSVYVPAWRRRFLTDEAGDIVAVQEPRVARDEHNRKWIQFETVARPDSAA